MKKILSFMLSAIIIFSCATTTHAQDVVGNGMASSTAIYHVESQYCVLIPETIDLNANSCTFSSSFMDIADNEYVDITLQNPTLTLSNDSGKTIEGQLMDTSGKEFTPSQSVATFSNTNQEAKQLEYSFMVVSSTSAGDYTGTITFDINLRNQ